eukprot:scaffold498_cov348-Pinguiococcus_pyrenoidosus.AAC.6
MAICLPLRGAAALLAAVAGAALGFCGSCFPPARAPFLASAGGSGGGTRTAKLVLISCSCVGGKLSVMLAGMRGSGLLLICVCFGLIRI